MSRVVSNLRIIADEMRKLQGTDPAWAPVCDEAAKIIELIDARLMLSVRFGSGSEQAMALNLRKDIHGPTPDGPVRPKNPPHHKPRG